MTDHERIVAWVLAEEKKHVHEIPMGSNRGPRVEFYQSHDFLAGGGYAWCCTLWLSALAETGNPFPYKSAGAYDLDKWSHKHGYGTSTPEPGDGVCWNLGAGHWSTFLRFEGNMVVTCDGNVGDRVQICKRPKNQVRGFTKAVLHDKPIKPVKPPLFVVTTSINGHRQVIVTQRSMKAIQKLGIARMVKNHPAGITITRSNAKKKVLHGEG